ncbi:hypothetical protein Mapa_009220 [Marchantia paleacea]|nr:hypothetical protein Mapa_009220 [Marchantia paleacea]
MLRAQSLFMRQLHGLQSPGVALRKQCGFSTLTPAAAASSGRVVPASFVLCQARGVPRDEIRSQRDSLSRTWRLVSSEAAGHSLRVPTARVSPSAITSARYATASVDGGSGGGGKQGGEGGSGGNGGQGGAGGAGDSAKSSRLWAFWLWYMGCLDARPIFTKALTSAILTFFGDLFCQFVVENAEKLDIKRICTMTSLGFCLTGPTLHFWYLALHKFVTVGGPVGVGVRLALDQFVFSPAFIAVFISSLMTLEGNSSQITAKLKQDLWPAVLMNWRLWIPAQTINFMFVPQKLQVAFANVIALAWNTYMSYQSHKKVEEVKVIQMEELSIKSS